MKKNKYNDFVMSLAITVVGYLVLATLRLNYFNQDDNFIQFGPVIIAAMRSWFEHGIFPQWNPYQLMGAPVVDVGTYALTYPPTYLSYLLAQWTWGDPAAWVDFFFLIHALPGMWIMTRLLREFGVDRGLAFAASSAFIFCGFNLIAGRSWFYMLPLAFWLPCLFYSVANLAHAKERWWIAMTALCIGISFHSGNVQMWIYSMLFWVSFVAYRMKTEPQIFKLWSGISVAFLLGISIALPLLYVQALFGANVTRVPFNEPGIGMGFIGMLLPEPLITVSFPRLWLKEMKNTGHLYYAGSVFTIAALACSYLWIKNRRQKKSPKKFSYAPAVPWLVLGWIAFWLSLGDPAGLWNLVAYLPVFEKFRHSMKLLPYVHFFWIVGGVLFLQQWLKTKDKRWQPAITVLAFALLANHLLHSTAAFYFYGNSNYPPFPPKLMSELKKNANSEGYFRIDVRAPVRDFKWGYLFSLPHNIASVYGVGMIDGYDPLIAGKPEDSFFWKTFEKDQSKGLLVGGVSSQIVHNDGKTSVNKIENSDPIAFAHSPPRTALPYQVSFAGVDIQASEKPTSGNVTVSFLDRENVKVYVDDKPVPHKRDEWGRIQVLPPVNWKQIKVRYEPPWGVGFALALLAAGLGFGLWYRMSGVTAKPLRSRR